MPENIQELHQLLKASSSMGTTPMAGKFWQPRDEHPHSREEKQAPKYHTIQISGKRVGYNGRVEK